MHIGKAIVNPAMPTMYELFDMHAEGRGQVVEREERAFAVFGLYEGTVTAFDTNVVASGYMA